MPEPIAEVLDAVQRHGLFSLDLECRAPDGHKSADATDARLAIPTHVVIGSLKNAIVLPADDNAWALLRTMCSRPDLTMYVHYALYDLVVLHDRRHLRLEQIAARIIDPMVLQFLVHERHDRGLKELVQRYFRKRMVTYKEASNGPLQAEINRIEDEIHRFSEIQRRLPRQHPWPNWRGSDLITPVMIRGKVKAEQDRLYPGKLTPAGNRSWSAEERAGRKELAAKGDALIEATFGESAVATIAHEIEHEAIIPLRKKVEELEVQKGIEFIEYARADGLWTARLGNYLERKVAKLGLGYWAEIECQTYLEALAMSVTGTPIDVPYLREFGEKLQPVISSLQATIFDIAKQTFNIDSPTQMRELLFVQMRLMPPVIRTDHHGRRLPKLTPAADLALRNGELDVDVNRPETLTDAVRSDMLACDKETMERLEHPIGQAVLDYRTAQKLHGTYTGTVLERVAVHPENRICSIFNSIGAEKTGRWSSSDPNLQNIPSRSKGANYDPRVQKLGPQLRRAYIAPPGYVLIVGDMSQIELRKIASVVREPRMMDIYHEGMELRGVRHYVGDIHRTTSKNLSIDRKSSKGVNFGFAYGMGALRFCRQQQLYLPGTYVYDIDRAMTWRTGFLNTYSGLRDFFQEAERCWSLGMREVKMTTGRIRHFVPEDYVFGITGGKILNAIVQGSCADMLKIGIHVIRNYVKPVIPSLTSVFQVHDEVGYLVKIEEAPLAACLIKRALEVKYIPIATPLLASIKLCRNWAEKDDDDVPEFGTFYARIDDTDRLFTPETWSEFRALEKAGKVQVKSAGAVLSLEQIAMADRYIPSALPQLACVQDGVDVLPECEETTELNLGF